ncbi:MAG: redoxin family protein [Bacteroidetes bacterium]|nr:redoxin family protein [Bacteroidota bacterium]
MKNTILFAVALLLATALKAEKGCEITIKLDYYRYDTLWFGTSFGKRAVPDFAAAVQPDGSFVLKTDKPLDEGMYAIIYKRTPSAPMQYFQCWIVNGQRKFSISTNASIPYERPIIVGSPENVALFDYLRQLNVEDKKMDEMVERDRFLQTEEEYRKRVQVEEEMHQMQLDFIKNTPAGPTTKLVQQTLFPIPPASNGKKSNWKQEANERYQYQKAHFFDNTDIGTPDFMRYLQWLDRTDFYLLSLPPSDPDTLKSLIDQVLKRLEAYPEGYDYYQKYLTNSFTKLSKYRSDEVYVYLVRNYLEKGKANWASTNDIRNATNGANQMELLFEGKPAPTVTMLDRDNNPVPLYDISAKLTLLVFYMPDCGHCKREIPQIATIYEKYKDKGLKVAAVCLKTGDDVPSCWEFTDSQNLPKDWYLLADPKRQANLPSMFSIKSYPRMFLLDADKKIVYKQNGEMADWQFDAVLGEFLK